MKKFLLLVFISLLIVSGCSSGEDKPENLKNLEGVKVVDKSKEGGRAAFYYVTLEKNSQSVKLQLTNKSEYEAIKKGTVINVKYSEKYIIKDVEFAGLEN